MIGGLLLAPFFFDYLFPEVYVMQNGCHEYTGGRLVDYMVLDNMNPDERAFHAWIASPGKRDNTGDVCDDGLVDSHRMCRLVIWYWELKHESPIP